MKPDSVENRDASFASEPAKPEQGRKYKLFIAEGYDHPIATMVENVDYELSGIAEADFIVYPILVRNEMDVPGTLAKISRQFSSSGKKVIVFTLSDYARKYPFYSNLILLRHSARADRLASNERVMPYLWECKDEPFVPASAGELPGIGFCGKVSRQRRKLVSAFENSALIKCDFIKRDSFWGGKPHDPGVVSDFWSNMQENPFALAPRGNGNFSMRFYQALSIGRIPVLINTNMALPLSNLIPWKDFIVFEENEKRCVRRLLEIHEGGRVTELQQTCYRIFHEYLSHKVYMGRLLDELSTASVIRKPTTLERLTSFLRQPTG